MAYITKTKESVFQKASEMAQGSSIEGYYLGIEKSAKGYTSLKFLPKGSTQPIALNPAGNLNYFAKDTADGVYQVGLMTRVTRIGDRPNKKDPSLKVGIFRVEQDPEDVYTAGVGIAAAIEMNSVQVQNGTAIIAEKIAALKAKQA